MLVRKEKALIVAAAAFILSLTMASVDRRHKPIQRPAAEPPAAAVTNSPWDGSVRGVERYLAAALNDPDSYQPADWGPVRPVPGGYTVRHRYRARNTLGGVMLHDQIFWLDSRGSVGRVENTPR